VAEAVRVRAYAKLNLALEVLGRRDDRFHEIATVVQTISLHDDVECRPAAGLRVETEPPVVAEADNLAYRAAAMLAAARGRSADARVRIRKRIPLAAGLGGGSSDAAATLRGLDRLWRTGLGRDALHGLAEQLGSDVPLFLSGGAALVRGRGEVIQPLSASASYWLAVATPPIELPDKTRALYRALGHSDLSDGQRTQAFAERLHAGGSPTGEHLPNAFDRAAADAYPDFAALRERLNAAAGLSLRLTGAGPSLFGVFATRAEASRAALAIERCGVKCRVARPVAGSRVRVLSEKMR
jgi:4-diphosphocytidyl-2-C-methyl-D-erythritol kinase